MQAITMPAPVTRNVTAGQAKKLVQQVVWARACVDDARTWARQLYLSSLNGDPETRCRDYPVAVDAAANIEHAEAYRALCLLSVVEEHYQGQALVSAVIDGDTARAEYHATRYLEVCDG